MTALSLSFDNVSLIVGECRVLQNTTLNLSLHGITVLRGPNGAGKTSLLRALLGLIRLQNGQILLNGETPQKVRTSIGYMPQTAGEYAPMLPVLSHVSAALNGLSWGFKNIPHTKERAYELLHQTGAHHLAHRPLGVLSGGERQRVALAQALANSPKFLILDEPFASLDQQTRQTHLEFFSNLTQNYNIALLMTAHEELSLPTHHSKMQNIYLEKSILHA